MTIFIFHLPVLSSFMTDKKFMEEGNSQYMEVITYKNVMWRKGSYLLEGPLVLCSVSWCSPKPGESVWQSLHPGMSTPAKPPQAHPATGKSSFTLTSGRQQAVVMNHHKNTCNSFTSIVILTSLRMGILATQGGLRVEQYNEPGASVLKTHDPNFSTILRY